LVSGRVALGVVHLKSRKNSLEVLNEVVAPYAP
jgi:hypothetical protein